MKTLNPLGRIALAVGLAMSLLSGSGPRAQGGEEEAQAELAELVRQIRRNMVEVEKDLDRVEAEGAKAAASEARENLDKLVSDMKSRGKQITTDIEEFIKKLPP